MQVREAFLDKISLSATGFYRYNYTIFDWIFSNRHITFRCVFVFALRGQDLYMDWNRMEGQPYAYFTYGVCCSEVELDCLTGDYRVWTQLLQCFSLEKQVQLVENRVTFLFSYSLQTLRTDIVVDIGRSVNPSVDIGQVEPVFI